MFLEISFGFGVIIFFSGRMFLIHEWQLLQISIVW